MSDNNNNGDSGNAPAPDRSESGNPQGHGRSRGRGQNGRRPQRPCAPSFQGREPSLKGHVYDLSSQRNSEQCVKTTKEVMNWVGREHSENTGEFCEAVQTLDLADPTPPADPPAGDNIAFERWKIELKKHADREEAHVNFLARLYTVVLGQCTEALEDRLRSHTGWLHAQQNGIRLLQMIKTITYTFEDRRYLPDAVLDVKEEFYRLTQGRNESLQRYYERFKNQVSVMDEVGVNIVDPSVTEFVAAANGRAGAPNGADRLEATNRTLATRFIRGANKRFKPYLTELRHAALNNHNDYPVSLTVAYNIMQRRSEAMVPVIDPPDTDGIAFVTAGRNGRSYPNINCHNCHEDGHYADQCPNEQGSGEQGMVFTSSVGRSERIPLWWLLLDNEANVDLIRNRKMLNNIRRVPNSMTVHCNAGSRSTNLMGDLPGYPKPVWYSPHAIANILSLSNVKSIPRWRVSYSSDGNDAFMVSREDGSALEFGCSDGSDGPRGLHRCVINEDGLSGMALVNTVAENKTKYTNEECNRAVSARTLQKIIGRPSTKDFIRYITRNQIPNCTATKNDIVNAENTFGPEVASLKGKTVRRDPPRVRMGYAGLPPEVKERYQVVTICADIMHVNGIPFFVSISRVIKFGTAQELSSKSKKVVLKAIDNVLAAYHAGGFRVRYALMDGAFESYKPDLADPKRGVILNTTARDEHVGDIERYIRTLKERTRANWHSVPFTRVPSIMVVDMVKSAVFWRNAFPVVDGASDELSPRTIITGANIDFNRHCRFEFGEYVQTHEQHDNSMDPRTVGALVLRPTGNAQGSHYFLSLATGRRLNRLNATKLPMPAEVIDRVHVLARRQNANRGLVFGDRDNIDLEDDEDDGWDDGDDSTHAPSLAPTDEEDPDDDVDPDNCGLEVNCDEVEEPIDGDADEVDIQENAGVDVPLVEEVDPQEDSDSDSEDEDEPDDAGSTGVDAARSEHYDLRPLERRNYAMVAAGVDKTAVEETLATPQMSMKRGLEIFGDQGVQAVRSEMQQLHDRKVMDPRPSKELTREQKKEALAYLMFLKRKRCGKIKARGCADGRKQRAWIDPEAAASPTVSLEAVMLTAAIDAMEGREVAVIDVPGAFMQADMDELVHVRFTGKMVELLMEIDPDMCGPCIVKEGRETVLYVELLKALYGTLRAARLFWEKLTKQLLEWGFTANPHDSCVMNKMVNGKQLTVAWHVDDLKISHVDALAVDHFIDQMEEEFGKEAPLSKSRGKVHDYLGMVLDYSKPGKLVLNMIDYIKTVLAEVPMEMRGRARTPAANHLFTVNNGDPVPLDDERAKTFYRIVMQLQYLSQRARPDLRTAISFLCKRVTKSDEDDWKKLIRVVKYLDCTKSLMLTLEAGVDGVLHWFVDASFGVHHDMKGHTGALLTMGKGTLYSTSSAHKLVARSSTEAELIGVHDVLPQMLWTLRFLEAQGFKVNGTILHQDNKSAMLLEKNGRGSSSRRTRHIELRYYFVKEHVDAGTIKIVHCPTKEMWADYFTKPVQGGLFY